ncbi:MAG: amino acid--[acyl-carrier-protein] ligase [Candidatus Binataceae bacterium]|nr:amino acid--[acyl-carrier-protein] ligase [Candidatus Binataceae bacterium]
MTMNSAAKDHVESITKALLIPTAAAGVYARTALFEQVVEGLAAFIGRRRDAETEILRFPPVMSRQQLQSSGYLQSFPHLLGCVSSLDGDESDIRALVKGSDWLARLATTDMVLNPAACYPVYPLAAARGQIPAKGLLFDVAAYCFRHEATHEIDRLQAFQMREYLCLGSASQALGFRDRWLSRADEFAMQLGLPHRIEPASDPFFGRAGRLASISQLEQSLKFELLVSLHSDRQPTACMSFNYHLDHFGKAWNLRTETGQIAHTACVAFGMERLALALFATHGIELTSWPTPVRTNLSL